MTIDRTTIIRGPCKITHNGGTFYTKDGATLTVSQQNNKVLVDGFGTADQRRAGLEVKVSFTPHGYLGSLGVLLPYASMAMGSSVFGATDKPLVITSLRETVTVKNAAVTKMPSLICSASKTPFGSIEFTGLVANNAEAGDIASYITQAAGASPGSPADLAVVLSPYTMTLGDLDPFASEGGFEFAASASMSPVQVDGAGTVDMVLTDVSAKLTCMPIGTSEDFLSALDNVGIGASVPALDCSVGGNVGSLSIVFQASIASAQSQFAAMKNGKGTLTLDAIRTFTAGAMDPLWEVGLVP